jgi:hypothetical protein
MIAGLQETNRDESQNRRAVTPVCQTTWAREGAEILPANLSHPRAKLAAKCRKSIWRPVCPHN